MAKPTTSDKKILSVLEDLATQARNSQNGYQRSAEDVKDGDLRSIFADLARERERQADELDQIIQRLGGTPPSREGSMAGAMHRTWVDLRSAITGGDRQSILQEVFRGESRAEATYDKALKQNLQGMTMPEDAQKTLQEQHASIRAARDRFRSMLEAMGAQPAAVSGGMMDSLTGGVESYVVDRPMLSTTLAFGIGLVLGALLTMSMQPGTSYRGERQTGQRRGRESGYGMAGQHGGGRWTYAASRETRYGGPMQ